MEVFLELPNPKYRDMQKILSHLKDITINEINMKDESPVNLILGAGDCTKIIASEIARVGQQGDAITELKKLDWVIISSGIENVVTKHDVVQNFNSQLWKSLFAEYSGSWGETYKRWWESLWWI